jgi:hypothetical protein
MKQFIILFCLPIFYKWRDNIIHSKKKKQTEMVNNYLLIFFLSSTENLKY